MSAIKCGVFHLQTQNRRRWSVILAQDAIAPYRVFKRV